MLNANATPFIPSYETIVNTHPHSPGGSGFILLTEGLPKMEVDESELFNSSFYPLSDQDVYELTAVDDMNSVLEEFAKMETKQELYAHQLICI